jgi:hypothetical protein
LYWSIAPAECIDIFKSYFFSNIETIDLISFKVKQLVESFIPLLLIHDPSSIIQIAKAKGDKYSSIQTGITFLPFNSDLTIG